MLKGVVDYTVREILLREHGGIVYVQGECFGYHARLCISI